jgi:hypothetical protein
MLTDFPAEFWSGLYNGATGVVTDMKFLDTAIPEVNEFKFKLLPTAKSDGSMARQVHKGRPIPVVYVQLDNDKVDTTLFPNRIVPITTHQYTLIGGKGLDTVYRYVHKTNRVTHYFIDVNFNMILLISYIYIGTNYPCACAMQPRYTRAKA